MLIFILFIIYLEKNTSNKGREGTFQKGRYENNWIRKPRIIEVIGESVVSFSRNERDRRR